MQPQFCSRLNTKVCFPTPSGAIICAEAPRLISAPADGIWARRWSLEKLPCSVPCGRACVMLGGRGWRGARVRSGSRPVPGSGSWGAARWSLVFPGDVLCTVTADGRDTISSSLAEQNTGTWCVCSCATLLSAGTRAAQLAPQGSPRSAPPGVVPLADVAGLCAGAAALGSAPALPAHLKPHKIEDSCKFTATCPGSCLVLPRWHSPRPFPGALPTGACAEWSPASPGGLKAWQHPLKPGLRQTPAGRQAGAARSGVAARGSRSRKQELKGEQSERGMGRGWWAAPGRPPAAAVRNEVTF